MSSVLTLLVLSLPLLNCRFSKTKSSIGPQYELLGAQLQYDALREGGPAEGDPAGDEVAPGAAPAAAAPHPEQAADHHWGGAAPARRPQSRHHGHAQSPNAQLAGRAAAIAG